jgi:ribose transport system substrate-binding protein
MKRSTMKLKNRLLAGLAVAVLALIMTGCTTEGGGASSTAGGASPTAHGPKNGKNYVFGNIAYNMKDVWNTYSTEAFTYAGKSVGVQTITLDSENSLENSVSQMQGLIAKNVDGISVFPISPEQAGTLGKMANDAGIPITFENTTPALDKSKYISIVGAQYDQIGEAAINYIAKTYPGAKVLFVAGAQGGGVYESYQKGVDRALKKLAGSVKVVSIVHGNWETGLSMNVTANAIQAGTKFDVVFANSELMAKGVKNALVAAGLNIPIIATGGGPDGLKMIQDGELTATMSAPVSLQGLITFRNLYQSVVEGKTPEKSTPLPIIPVDKSTMGKAISWKVDAAALKYIGGIK